MTADKPDAYQLVTDRVLAALDAGIVPWVKPWTCADGPHKSLSTGKAYRGSNIWVLELAARFNIVKHPTQPDKWVLEAKPKAEQFESPWWGTFNQIRERGGMVRKGQKGTYVTFWKQYLKRETMTDDDGAELESESSRFALRYYSVFNADQCDGLTVPEIAPRAEITPDAAADAIAAAYLGAGNGPSLSHGGDRAYFDHDADAVRVPDAEAFRDAGGYYATLFHELTHSTGHHSRIARRAKGEARAFGCEEYAKEELVAEMGSAMLCAVAGIEPDYDQTAAYIASWRKAIAEDKRLVVGASAQAQRAAEWVQGIRYGKDGKLAATVAA